MIFSVLLYAQMITHVLLAGKAEGEESFSGEGNRICRSGAKAEAYIVPAEHL
jgi:hypothetical protein